MSNWEEIEFGRRHGVVPSFLKGTMAQDYCGKETQKYGFRVLCAKNRCNMQVIHFLAS